MGQLGRYAKYAIGHICIEAERQRGRETERQRESATKIHTYNEPENQREI